MNDNKLQLINGLRKLTAELKSAQIILCQRTIKRMLKYIASNEELKFITSHCNGLASYSTLLSEASKGNNALAFALPSDPHKVICLVTGILFNIDRENIDFLSFLKTNFASNQAIGQFGEFCDYVMVGYVDAFEVLLLEDSLIVNVDEAPISATIPPALIDKLSPFILAISEQILIDKSINECKREESLAVLEGICYVLEHGNSVLIKSMWIGLKYTINTSKVHASHLKGMENILSEFGLLR